MKKKNKVSRFVKYQQMNKRKLNFKFNEDQLISMLSDFFKWVTEKSPDEEERGLIASYVMEGTLKIYEIN